MARGAIRRGSISATASLTRLPRGPGILCYALATTSPRRTSPWCALGRRRPRADSQSRDCSPLAPGYTPSERYQDPEFRLRFARLVTHYWRRVPFLEDGQLLRNAATLNGIPGVLIHGRYDVSSPLETA